MLFQFFVWGTAFATVFSSFLNLPLYLAVIVIIIRNKRHPPFNSSFYTIFTALGIVDLACYFLYTFIKKPIFWGFIPDFFKPFNEPNQAAKISLLVIWLFAFLQYEYVLLLTLNRFAGICFPEFYLKYWTKRVTRILLALPIIFSITVLIPCTTADFTVTEYIFENNGIRRLLHGGPITVTPEINHYFSNIWEMHIYVLMIGGVILYTLMYIKAKLMFRSGVQANKAKLELRMLKQAAMLFALNFIFCGVFFVRKYLSDENNEHLYEYMLLIVSDVYDLPNGVILLLTSGEIRRKLRHPWQKIQKTHTTVNVHFLTRSTVAPEKTSSINGF
ncbi:unnamed protein product [Bursaphelenchus okinawaensis]|uniref:G-protein coupled receptors family 1 profile domain-containing protein n=1 Tax=Bursaphelenchus okinawaensis TaxID=465554 RepID=A0A811L0R0_9BILA|nr:unnamed protein product [Bursaphelenchus okinawaensis]CAG9114429.1 unnamed protein product [Bursaphelenchus okinawaensis]